MGGGGGGGGGGYFCRKGIDSLFEWLRRGRGGRGGGGEGTSVERLLTVCSNGCVQLNKMASMPIYGEKA